MTDRIVEAKNDTDEEPEEGEIQDDGFEDVSSDEEISSITKREESVMYSHSFVLHKVSKVKRQGLCSPRSDVRFHVPEKPDHISQTSQKRTRSGLRPGEHDYYEMFHRYNKSFKDHHSKGRIHEKENKARESKKLYKKSSLHNTIIESRSMYGGDHSEGRYSSTSSKGSWHQCEVKEKHKKKKKSKSNKSYPLVEVHESQTICSKDLKVSEESLKTTMNVKEDKACEKGELKQDKSRLGDVQSPTSSDIEILDVPKKIPEVITIESDDDGQLLNLNKDDTELEVSGNPSLEVDNCNEPIEPDKEFDHESATELVKKAGDDGATDSTEVDENLELLREAALNSSKTEQSLHINPDDEVLQLRLAALRSAIIRKFEERKKRGITLTKRGRNAEGKHAMSISPLSSPNHCSSGESYVQVSEETNMFLPSGEFIAARGSSDLQNDSEIDKITAVDMELVESDEEKENASILSEGATSQNVSPLFTDDNNVTKSDSPVKDSSERRSLDDISEENLPNTVSQSISASQSPIMHSSEFRTVETEVTASLYVNGNSEKTSDLIGESHLPSVPVYVNSQSLPCDNNHSLEVDEENKIQQPNYDCGGFHETEHNYVQENVLEDVNNLRDSNSKAESPLTFIETCKLDHNNSEKESNVDLLVRDVNDSDDSCSSADLDLGSMIVLDEVGKCSDDNKSEGSIMDVASGTEHQLVCHSSESRANQGSYKVNSFKLYVRNANVSRHLRQCSGNLNLNSENRERFCKPVMVLDHSEVKSIDTPFSQRSVNQNNLINCIESRGNAHQFHEHCISVNSDSRDNHNCINKSIICDKILVKDSGCKNCNSSSSNRCNCDAIGEGFKNKQFSKEEETKSNLSEQSGDTSVEFSDTFRPLLVNSNDLSVGNTGESPIENATMNVHKKNVEKLEFGSNDKEETVLDEFFSVSENRFTEPRSKSNEMGEPISTKSNSQFPISVNEKGSHSIEKEIEVCGDQNNSPNSSNISVEEDEEVLRHSLLAMINKKSKDIVSENSSLPSPQNIEAKENILSSTNVGCNIGHVENIVLEPQAIKPSLPHPNTVSSSKSAKVNVPMKPLLPSKSSSVNPKVYSHHTSLTHTKPVFPCRNKLISVNKTGAKSNKTRMIKTSSSGRANIVPEFVINLGEDSDSGDDANELRASIECTNTSTELIDQPAAQIVPSDFAKKLDLLLKQARFEQEGVSSEEKDDSGDNDQVEPTKYINVSSVSTEEISESVGGAIESSSVSGHPTLDKPVGNAPGVSASLANGTNNSATTCDKTVSTKENVSSFDHGVTRKISSPSNISKTITPDGKKKSTTNILMSSVVDIGLLPSCKQKEYLRLKKQLAQFAQKVEGKCKENREIKNILGNANNKEDTTLQTLVRRNVIKNNFGANVDRTIITRKLIRRVQVSSQTARNEIIKSRKLVKIAPNVNNAQSQQPVTLPSTSFNKAVSLPLCPSGRKIPLQHKKVANATVSVRKSTTVPFTSTAKQKKSPSVVNRYSTEKSGESREVPCSNLVIKCNQQRKETGPVSVAKTCTSNERSSSLKRKKSISESSSGPVRKKCPLKLQSSTIQTCDKEENLKNEVPKSIGTNKAPENANRTLAEELWVSENKLMAKRYQVLEDLASVRVHLHEIERVNIMKQQILLDIKMLREKIHFAETQLSQKDELLNTLYSEVEDGKRNIMRGQSETLLLSVECEEKGCKIHGPDYSVPNTCTDMIRNGMLSISKTLQNLKEGKGSIESICEMSTFCTSGEKPLAEDGGQRVSGSVHSANEEENKQVQHSYSSPLDAIRTESGSDIQRFLCPYYIMGSCKDKECSYLH